MLDKDSPAATRRARKRAKRLRRIELQRAAADAAGRLHAAKLWTDDPALHRAKLWGDDPPSYPYREALERARKEALQHLRKEEERHYALIQKLIAELPRPGRPPTRKQAAANACFLLRA